MNTPEEFKKKYLLSIGFVAFIGIGGFGLGMAVRNATFTDENIKDKIEALKETYNDKLSDLEEDINKEDQLLREEIKRVEEKIGRKIKNHELAKHK